MSNENIDPTNGIPSTEATGKGGIYRNQRISWTKVVHRKYQAEHLLQSLLLSSKSGGDDRATLSRTVEVLERREQGRDTRLLLGLRVSSRERRRDAGVVDSVARSDVRVQALHEKSQ